MSQYPSGLPRPTKAFHRPKDRVMASDLPGKATYSQRERDYAGTVDVEFFFTAEQAAAFFAWWRDDLLYGGKLFSAVWPALRPGPLVYQFASNVTHRHVYLGAYRVSATVEIRGASELPVDGAAFSFTSSPYPATIEDSLDVSGAFVSGGVFTWPVDTWTLGHSFVGATLETVVVPYTAPTEEWTVGHFFVGATLEVVALTLPTYTEELSVNHSFVSGTLEVVQITYSYWPQENLDVAGAFVSGVLT